ncbi:MAG: adenylate/guanylate cyclase domain-containing protein [Alphaproteobacteria bacterium]|jgi:adenylate cyclase|nr:adenylate/guanylate cyclase domain-containing protein [Alphaproteobacteria bacterium]
MTKKVERRLAAILSADVVGYSNLMEADEAGTLARLKAHRAELFDPITEENGGRIVKLMGDGALVEFPSVVGAVRCAIEVQRGMSMRNESLTEGERITLRIGVNLGDVIIEGEDIYGEGVNIAARLQGLAAPGGVSVSGKVHDEVRGKVEAAFEDQGEKSVKNIAQPIRVYALTSADEALTRQGDEGADLALPSKPSIAVLPFNNMSEDAGQEYFADGIADDILTGLSRFHDLFVIARNSSFIYKGSAVDIKQVGRELGVRYVLEGGVRKAGDRVRITAQLIEAETGNHLWAEKYDGELADIFDLQDEITASVVGAIQTSVSFAEIERARGKHPSNLDAHDHIMRGWAEWIHPTQEGMANAKEHARAALALDARYATAYTLLGWADMLLLLYGWSADHQATIRTAKESARRAVELDDGDGAAYAVLGCSLVLSREHDTALAACERAVRVNPNLAGAAHIRGLAYVCTGRPAEGVEECRRALRLSPRDPETFGFLNTLAMCQYALRDYEAAAGTAEELVALKPDYIFGHWHVAIACAQLGRTERAERAFQEILRIKPNFDQAFIDAVTPFQDRAEYEHEVDGLRKAGWQG